MIIKYLEKILPISKVEHLHEKMNNNSTYDIILAYIVLIIYKILPILLTLSICGYSNIFINIMRYIIFCYLIVNLLISDIILRQSIKLRTNINIIHNCEKCPTNFIWNIQDCISYLIFNIVGSIIFKYNIWLDIYWRGYIHTIPYYIKNKICISKSIEYQYIFIFFGILNSIIESIFGYFLPFEYLFIVMYIVTFIIDCIVFNLHIPIKQNTNNVSNILIIIPWKISQFFTVGFMEIRKRKYIDKNIIEDIIHIFNYLRDNTYYKIILWKEFQSYENFVSYGKTSVYFREQILHIYELFTSIINFLDNNTALIIIRKIKLLHITTLFKPFMSSQHKFYVSVFESRKIIEKFIKQFVDDLKKAIGDTENETLYESLYNYVIKAEDSDDAIIDKYFEKTN
jgi:hypothetical protein